MAIYIDDQQLVAAHQAGDSEAFEELVREYRRPLIAHAHNKLGCISSAEDAFQETLVRAYRALPNFDGEYKLGPWLHRIMANVCVDEANRRKRDGDRTERLSAQPSSRRLAASPEDELGLHIDDTDLHIALNALPEPQKEALVLRFVDDLDYDQLAEISGVSEQNARARVSRARAAMRSAMKGVAALPVLFVGLLKRGEKAAAAATSGGAIAATSGSTAASFGAQAVPALGSLPAFAEVSTAAAQAAPHAVPMIAKAAVGIGLAAAVLTPTSDSAVHQTVENLTTGSVDILEVDDGADDVLGGSVSSLQMSDPVVVSQDPKAQVVQSLELGASVNATPADAIGIEAKTLEVVPAGPDSYDVTGAVEIAFADSSIIIGNLNEASRISISSEEDFDGRRRVDGLLVATTISGTEFELRIAGFAIDQNEELRIAGLFRASGAFADFPERGSFSGTMNLGSDSSPGALAFTLSP